MALKHDIILSLMLCAFCAAFNINGPNYLQRVAHSSDVNRYRYNIFDFNRGRIILHSKSTDNDAEKELWTHSDIEWRLSPPPEAPLFEKLKMKAGAKALHAELILKDQPVPPVLCPKGGKAELEGYKNGKKIAKFGITTSRGPSAPPVDDTISELYDIQGYQVGIGAIIYMFVEPEYRGLGIGTLALEAIAAIQTVQGIDFTVLVTDDNGSGKLIKWYEESGYKLAPKLQEMFGSPDGKFGLTMIRPTEVRSDIFARCQIKWWL